MKRYVVTGAGGSIGSHLCELIIRSGAESLCLVSLTESGLYNVERKLRAMASGTEIKGVLGSVCDARMMSSVFQGADVVIHAAAHKHVPICENNPIAAIENNVGGTLSAVTAAESAKVKQFLSISTDKAVRPVSVMGATKRVAEMVVSDAARKTKQTIFSTVRFGNVMDSAGSVLPLWREQIANGGPITLTDRRCERYFMSIPETCELIFGVLDMRRSGTFVFDMGKAKKMIDIAEELVKESGSECEIECIGLRPGEKIIEELHFGGDLDQTSNPKILEVIEGGKSHHMMRLVDMLSAASCRNEKVATDILREMVC